MEQYQLFLCDFMLVVSIYFTFVRSKTSLASEALEV
jgi:hypothetical protein